MTIQEFNLLDRKRSLEELLKCCGSIFWAERMIERKPFENLEELTGQAEVCWSATPEKDVLEAFSHHPKIGDLENLKKKFAATREWAGSEQGAMNFASPEIIEELSIANKKYEQKFGYIFIISATGKSAAEMLTQVKARIFNDPLTEFLISKTEQQKITKLRLNKLFS